MYRIVSQQADFYVIDKLPGVSVHKDQAECGLVMQLEQDLGEKLWLVHRLDKMTSGLMLLARNQQTAATLSALFRDHQVNKYYLAVSDRKPKKKQGTVSGDMVRSRRSGWRLTASQDNPAITQFFSASHSPGIRMILARPLSGKTHQIRVALKSLGAPIIGDPIYSEQTNNPADRGYLHAMALQFMLDGEEHRFIALPTEGELFAGDSFEQAVSGWLKPWDLPWPKTKFR